MIDLLLVRIAWPWAKPISWRVDSPNGIEKGRGKSADAERY